MKIRLKFLIYLAIAVIVYGLLTHDFVHLDESPSCTFMSGDVKVIAHGSQKHPMTKELCDNWGGEFHTMQF